jgi:hypothetical protein
MFGKFTETPAVVQTSARDVAHLVIEFGPANAPPSMTESDEVEGGIVGDGILGTPARIHMCTRSSSVPDRIRNLVADRRLGPGWGSVPPRVSPPRQGWVHARRAPPPREELSPPSRPPSSPQNGRSRTVHSSDTKKPIDRGPDPVPRHLTDRDSSGPKVPQKASIGPEQPPDLRPTRLVTLPARVQPGKSAWAASRSGAARAVEATPPGRGPGALDDGEWYRISDSNR